MPLKENDLVPQFDLLDQNEKLVSISDYIGKYVVAYFYPKDNTPGCTTEAIDFTNLASEFKKANAVILGINKDDCRSHVKFINDKKLGITLLSDPDAKVQKAFDVWKPKKFMGREFLGTIRTTFLIDPAGKIIKIWENVNPAGHAQEVLEEVKKIKK